MGPSYVHQLLWGLTLQWSRNQFAMGGGKVYWEGWTKTTIYNNKINKDRIHTYKKLYRLQLLEHKACMFAILRVTNRCVRGSRLKWRSSIGMDDEAGLALTINYCSLYINKHFPFVYVYYIIYICICICIFWLSLYNFC